MNMTQQELFKAFESLPTEAQRQALNFIAFLQQTYAPAIKPQKSEIDWTKDPFIGMWQDRQDMDENSIGDRTMDRVERYRQIVRTFLEEYAQESVSPNENVTAELVFDEKRDRSCWLDLAIATPLSLDFAIGKRRTFENCTDKISAA